MPTGLSNRLRIIGGAWRGRKLDFPSVEGLRPTPDRVRETLFNWLQHDIAGARCLDLFAGSGALGLEALSRGAANVVFCDQHPQVVNQIRGHLQTLNTDAGDVVQTPALAYLDQGPPAEAFNIVFLDPPFGQHLLAACIEQLEQKGWLQDPALIYLEAEASLVTMAFPENWQLLRDKTAGQVSYRLARRTGHVAADH